MSAVQKKKSVSQTLRRWSRICSGKQATRKTPENVESVRAAIIEDRQLTVQKLEADLGIPITVQDSNAGSWHETRRGKIHSVASAARAEGTLCRSC